MLKKLRKISTVNYVKPTTPDAYRCDTCNAHGVKLWREYQVSPYRTRLLCTHCAERDQKRENKIAWKSSFSKGVADRIGFFIPAIPEEGTNSYCGYFVTPKEGLTWWKNLPLENNKTES